MDMKLFRVIIILISFLLLNNVVHAGSTMPRPELIEDDRKSFTKYKFRYTQYMGFWLKKQEKNLHKSAVYFALDNARNGKIVSWYSKTRLVSGKVRVIHSYPISGGYCRTYQAYIKVNGKERHMTNNACKYIGTPSWSFYK